MNNIVTNNLLSGTLCSLIENTLRVSLFTLREQNIKPPCPVQVTLEGEAIQTRYLSGALGSGELGVAGHRGLCQTRNPNRRRCSSVYTR